MAKAKSKHQVEKISYHVTTHDLPGRTVTVVDILKGLHVWGRGVSIKNPVDSPVETDGIKFALTRAIQDAGLTKPQRAALWANFFKKYPTAKTPPKPKLKKALVLDTFPAARLPIQNTLAEHLFQTKMWRDYCTSKSTATMRIAKKLGLQVQMLGPSKHRK